MIYWELFSAFFTIGLFCFGGGYAALPLIQAQVVDRGWLTMTQFIDITTISQMTPGPIGINAATFVGMQMSGILGAICATLGFVVPSVLIVLTLSHFYFKYRNLGTVQGVLKGIQPAVVALIARSAWIILRESFWGAEAIALPGTNLVAVAIAAVMFAVLMKTKLGPIPIIFGSGVIGVIVYSIVGF